MTDTHKRPWKRLPAFGGAAWPPRSMVSFQLPLSPIAVLRSGLNSRTTWRLSAFIMPMRAIMVGPFFSAIRIRHSIAACHSPRFCSALVSAPTGDPLQLMQEIDALSRKTDSRKLTFEDVG
jgi:hypothetical protein